MAYLKTEAPVFRPEDSAGTRIERLAGFAAQLRRELDYVLTHLGGRNMNGVGLSLEVADSAGRGVGSLGASGSGVGLETDAASVTADDSGVCLLCGGGGLRVTAGGVEITEDGETWRHVAVV